MANLGIVACKLPNGLTIDYLDRTVSLKGANDADARHGYGLTPGVDLDWFNDWATGPGREFPAVARGLIFAAGNESNATDQAKEQTDERSGLEGLDPDKPAPGLEPTDETKAELAKSRR